MTLWFNQFLKNEFQMPETPETKLDLDTEDGTPVFSVTPDHSREILSVEVYYTQQDDSDYTGRVVAMTKYWQHAPAKKSEGTWTAPLPLFSTGRQLWVYADIAYALDREVFTSGGGQIVSSNIFNLSSLLTMVSADQLKAAGVTASEEPRLLIEGFRGDWEKEWFARGANRRKTFKLRSPQYQAPPNSKLGIEVQSDKKGRLTLGMEMEKDSYTSAISLNGDSKWQQVVLSPSDFKNKKGEKLADWNGVDIAIWLPGGWKWQDLKMRDLTWIKDSKGEP